MTPEEEKKLQKHIKSIRKTQFIMMFILLGIVILLAMLPSILQ